MQINAQQLQAIATSLSHATPWWQPYATAGLAAGLGVIGGVVGQFLQRILNDRRTVETMRKMGYQDILDILLIGETFLAETSSWQGEHKEALQKIGAKVLFPTRSHAYFESHIDLYVRVPERPMLDPIYGYLKELPNPELEKDSIVRCAMQFIVLQFEKKRLTRGDAKKYLGGENANSLSRLLERIKSVK